MTTAEIQPGVVAYFNVSVLNGHPDVVKPASPTTRNGPFICFEVIGAQSAWAPISNQYRRERIAIEKQWRLGGGRAWITNDQYLNDGSTTYVGPSTAFVEAAATIDGYSAPNRPRVTADGIAAVAAEVHVRGGNRLSA